MISIPNGEILKNLGDFRIVKQYYEHMPYKSKEPVISYRLILEKRFVNAIGEWYYAKAIDNPSDRGEGCSQERAYGLVREYEDVLYQLMALVTNGS